MMLRMLYLNDKIWDVTEGGPEGQRGCLPLCLKCPRAIVASLQMTLGAAIVGWNW